MRIEDELSLRGAIEHMRKLPHHEKEVLGSPGVVIDDRVWRDYVRVVLELSMVFPTREQLEEVAFEVTTRGAWNPRTARDYLHPPDREPSLSGVHPWWWSLSPEDRVLLAAILWTDSLGSPELLFRLQPRFPAVENELIDEVKGNVLRGRCLARRVRNNLKQFEEGLNRALEVDSLEEQTRRMRGLWPEGPRVLAELLDERRPLVAQELLTLAKVLGLRYEDRRPVLGGWEVMESPGFFEEDVRRGWYVAKSTYSGPEYLESPLPEPRWLEPEVGLEETRPDWIHQNRISCDPPREKAGVDASRQPKYRRLFQYLDDVPGDAVGVTLDLLKGTLVYEAVDGATHPIGKDGRIIKQLIGELPARSAGGRAFWANPTDHLPASKTNRTNNASKLQVQGTRAHARFWLAAGFTAKPKFSYGKRTVTAVTFKGITRQGDGLNLRSLWHPYRHDLRAGTYQDEIRLASPQSGRGG